MTAPELAFRMQYRVGLANLQSIEKKTIVSFIASYLYYDPNGFLPSKLLQESLDEYFREQGEVLAKGVVRKSLLVRVQHDLTKYFNVKVESGRRRTGKSYSRGLVGVRICEQYEISNLKVESPQIEFENVLNLDPFCKFSVFDYDQLTEPVNLQKKE